MTPDEIKASYSEVMDAVGETVKVRRYSGTPRTSTDYTARARVTGAGSQQLAGDAQQGECKIILLASDLDPQGFSHPITTADKIVVGGKEFAVISPPDKSTRKVMGVLIAYELTVRG